jgi:Sap, sulfolipid-1-addressing protein
MLLQAAGFALLAALSPTALLVAAVYLGSSRGRLTAAFYLTGAVIMSLATSVILIAVLRGAHLSRPADHQTRYGLRLGLGALFIAAGLIVAWRKRRQQESPASQEGFVARMVARPAPRTAFFVGILVFAPGATFLAALQVIATARASLTLTVTAVVLVVVINVLLVWLPIVLHVIAPDRTTRYLTAFNGWLRLHSRAIIVWGLVVVGGILVGNGIYGLAGR